MRERRTAQNIFQSSQRGREIHHFMVSQVPVSAGPNTSQARGRVRTRFQLEQAQIQYMIGQSTAGAATH